MTLVQVVLSVLPAGIFAPLGVAKIWLALASAATAVLAIA